MITITGRKLNIPREDLVVGYTGDNLVEVRVIELARYYDHLNMAEFDFKLDTQIGEVKNIIDLIKTVADDKIILTWVIEQGHILTPGRMSIQIRAFAGESVKWHSEQSYVLVQPSINGPEGYTSPLPSEFEQMEARVTTAKNQAQEAAQTAEQQADRAQGIADTFENVTLPASISAVEQAVEEQIGIAKGHADRAQGIADTFSNTTLPAAISAVEAAGQAKVDLAEAQAIIATTKAQEASDSAAAALASEQATKTSEDNAAGHAGTATEQADRAQDIADTFENETLPAAITAVEAAGQAKVDLAEQQANIAAGHAQTAAAKAEETSGYVNDAFEYKEAAEGAASIATEKAWEAANSAQIAEQQAGIAATKATEAYDSAERAKMSEEAVEGVADEHRLKIAKLEKELNDYKATMQQININQEATQQVTGYGVISLPKNAANGQVSVTLKGQTATNLVKNGNFADGTTGWFATNSTLSVNNNILSVIGNGSAKNPRVYNRKVLGNKTLSPYIKFKVRVTNSVCSSILIYWNEASPSSITTINKPVENQWYEISVKQTNVVSTEGNLFISQVYADAETANGKVMEVQEVMVIDMDAHGLQNLTADEMNAKFPHYFNGTKSTNSVRLVSVGKNLFDKSKFVVGFINDITGELITSTTSTRRSSDFIKVEPNKNYFISGTGAESHWGAWYDENKNFISGFVNYALVKTAPSNAKYIRFTIRDSDYLATTQFEKGTTATAYEPYKESIAYINGAGELRSLPNGTKDEIRVSENKLIKRIGDKTNVASGTVIDYSDMTTGGQFVAYASDGTSQVGVKGDTLTITATTLTYQLATPIEIPIQTSGSLVSYPSGTVYIEPFVADAGIYVDKMEVLYSDLPIKALEKLSKIDFMTGLETELDVSDAVIAEDKLSFTHPDLTSGDIVFFVYEHGAEGTIPETEISYYDSRYVIKGEDDKFYQWEIEAKLVEGVITPSIKLVEV